MKNVRIKYFAFLREKAGVDSELIQTQAQTYRELYLELSNKYQFTLPENIIQVAVNDEYSQMNQIIQDQDQIVFIPPVAGG